MTAPAHEEPTHDDASPVPEESRSRIEGLRVRGLDVKDQAEGRLDDAVGRFWPVALGVEAVKRWLSTNASILAGHLAFRFFLFLVPTAVVVVSLLGLVASGGSESIDSTSNSLRLSGPLANALATSGADTHGSHVQLGLAGVFGILVAGFSLVTALRTVFASVWDVPVKMHKRSRLLTLLGIIMLIVILLAANGLRRRLMAEGLVFTTMGVIAMFAVNSIFIGALTWLLPRRGQHLIDLVPSIVIGGIGLTALNTGAAWYFSDKLQSQSETYGAIGITLTLLTYLFVWGEVLVLSAIAGAVWYDREEILGRPVDIPFIDVRREPNGDPEPATERPTDPPLPPPPAQIA